MKINRMESRFSYVKYRFTRTIQMEFRCILPDGYHGYLISELKEHILLHYIIIYYLIIINK